MLVRLTGAGRWKAGWLLAFVYLLCVLAPTISFALPGSQAASPCLIDATHGPGVVHVHNAPARHVHMDGHIHDHSGAYSHTNSDGDRAISTVGIGSSVPEKAPHSLDGQCCGLAYVTALPVTLIEIVKLPAPVIRCEVEGDRKVSDNAPPRLYRPPVS
jgi:hypothetical protein